MIQGLLAAIGRIGPQLAKAGSAAGTGGATASNAKTAGGFWNQTKSAFGWGGGQQTPPTPAGPGGSSPLAQSSQSPAMPSDATSSLTKAADSIREFDAASRTGSGALGGLTNILKKATGPIGDLASQVTGLPSKIKEWGAALIDSQRHLAAYSGKIAGAVFELESGRIGRDIKTAGQTGGTFKDLAKSQNQLENSIQPFAAAWDNVANRVQEYINKAAASIVTGLGGVFKPALDWINGQNMDIPWLNRISLDLEEINNKDKRNARPPLPPL